MRILIDSREQLPFTFERYQAETEQATLPVADYSLPSFEDRVAIERKELNDIIACLMNGNRERFERELAKLRFYDLAAVVVEASLEDVSEGRFRSEMKPHYNRFSALIKKSLPEYQELTESQPAKSGAKFIKESPNCGSWVKFKTCSTMGSSEKMDCGPFSTIPPSITESLSNSRYTAKIQGHNTRALQRIWCSTAYVMWRRAVTQRNKFSGKGGGHGWVRGECLQTGLKGLARFMGVSLFRRKK